MNLTLLLEVTIPVALAALAILLLSGFTVHVLYRRPPAPLGSALPLVFSAALLFSVGDLMVNLAGSDPMQHWSGMIALYTGLLVFAPGWLAFTLRYTQIYAPGMLRVRRVYYLLPVALNVVLWVALISNPWHGQFLVSRQGAQSDYQLLWYVTAFSNYGLVVLTMLLQVMVSIRAQDPMIRSQCRFILAGTAIPLVASIAFVSLPGVFAFDPTALGFCLSCGIFIFAIYRRSFFLLHGVSLPELLERDTDAVLVASAAQRLMYANPSASALFPGKVLVPGLSVEMLLKESLPGLLTYVNGPDLFEFSTESEPVRAEDSSGRERWLTAETTPLGGRRDRKHGVCIRLRDRTELREALLASEAHAALLEGVDLAVGTAVLVTDLRGQVRYVNEAFYSLWKMDRPISSVRNADSMSEIFRKYLPDLPKGFFQRKWYEDVHRRTTGDFRLSDGRVVEVATFPVNHQPGFTGRVWRILDVTQNRQEAHSMLHTQKLEGLGVLAGGIAHDFNNLLVSMLGNAEMAREMLDAGSPVQAYLVDVEAAAERARELTGQLLAYTGKGKFVLEELDISSLVRSVTELLAVSIPKKVRLRYSLADEDLLVRGGGGQLRQIVMNLVTNAADAMGDGPGVIQLETGSGVPSEIHGCQASMNYGERTDRSVYLRVIDNGSGMDQNTLNRIFDPFFTTKFSGRGLGLAAALGIIQTHNGALQVESQLGRGSAFTLYLPASEIKSMAAGKVVEPQQVAPGKGIVLVVDDEDEVRVVTRRMLESSGFEVLVARDGIEALEVFERRGAEIEAVVLDMTMPNLNGDETWQRLRVLDPRVRVLFCSGYSEESADDILEEAGSQVGFIHKPYRREDLLENLAKLRALPECLPTL